MLAGDVLYRPRPDVIRVEIDEAGDWDDVHEKAGKQIDRWQVKRLQEALRDQPGVSGRVLLKSDVEI